MGGKKEQGWRWHIRGKGDVTDEWAQAPGDPWSREQQRRRRQKEQQQQEQQGSDRRDEEE